MRLHLDPASAGISGATPAPASNGASGAGLSASRSPASSIDSVSLSSVSRAVSDYAASRQDRISQLTALVRSSSYQVSSGALSQALITKGAA